MNGLPNIGFVRSRGLWRHVRFKLIAVVLNKRVLFVTLIRDFYFNLTSESLHFSFGNKVALIAIAERVYGFGITLRFKQLK